MSEYFEPWLEYTHPMVRQLAFCIASPNILQATPAALAPKYQFNWHDNHFWQQHYLNYKDRLIALDRDPQALLQFFKQLKSTRLGLRFEYLIWFWLRDSDYHHYEIIAHSHQVIEGPYTLGELDFLVYNRLSQQTEHWEVALKYYLAESNLALEHWYGLNRDDTLLKKLTHFSQHQFKFNGIQGHTINQRFAVMKGQLYLPHYSKPNSHPDWVNPDRRLGSWGQQVYSDTHTRLSRLEWLCPNFETSSLQTSSSNTQWWCNGLYYNPKSRHFYMFRLATLV